MPFTARQQQAAGAELGRRRKGAKALKGKGKRRPMGKVSIADLRDLASGPIKRGKA